MSETDGAEVERVERENISTAARSLARIADRLPATGKPVVFVLTKCEGGEWNIQVSEMAKEWRVKQ